MHGTVLVVEDDADIRESLVEIFDERGYRVVSANNGREALAALRGDADLPCLIFLDLMMPVMDGPTFREEQLRDPRLANVPVVVISAYRDVVEKARALKAEFLRKPFELNAVLGVARKYCGAV